MEGWYNTTGEWVDAHTLRVIFSYRDFFDGVDRQRSMLGTLSPDGATLTWVNSSNYGLAQLMTDVPWHRCELAPHKCTGPIMCAPRPASAPPAAAPLCSRR